MHGSDKMGTLKVTQNQLYPSHLLITQQTPDVYLFFVICGHIFSLKDFVMYFISNVVFEMKYISNIKMLVNLIRSTLQDPVEHLY